MALWMQGKKYRVGVQPQDINLRGEAALARRAINLTEQVIISLLGGGDDPFTFVSGGAKSEKVVQALSPLISLSNLIGLHLGFDGNDLMLVVFADGLSAEEVISRFKQFIELADPVADLGLRVNFKRSPFFVFPVVVYFNGKTFEQHSSTILSNGWIDKSWARLTLRACLVNVPQQIVTWTNARGGIKLAYTIRSLFVEHRELFTSEDLHTVLNLAQQQATPGHIPLHSNSQVVYQATWQPGTSHRDYPNVIASKEEGKWHPAPGYNWVDVQKNLQVRWCPGQPHRDYSNVIAAQKEGEWLAAPGYEWANSADAKDLRVVWSPGQKHPSYSNVIAGEDGKWYPAPGYRWVDVKKDLQVVWHPGQVHRDHPNLISGQKEGEWQSSTTGNHRTASSSQSENLITVCPICSQKLRAPSDRGILTLSCPKCKHSWLWSPIGGRL
jgi:hypothetical protein